MLSGPAPPKRLKDVHPSALTLRSIYHERVRVSVQRWRQARNPRNSCSRSCRNGWPGSRTLPRRATSWSVVSRSSAAGKLVKGSKKTVTDGPFAEAKDVVGGFTLIEARDLRAGGRALQGVPDPRGGRVGRSPSRHEDEHVMEPSDHLFRREVGAHGRRRLRASSACTTSRWPKMSCRTPSAARSRCGTSAACRVNPSAWLMATRQELVRSTCCGASAPRAPLRRNSGGCLAERVDARSRRRGAFRPRTPSKMTCCA